MDDTSGLGLFNVLIDSMESFGLNIDDIRGQGYDNGSNMKGRHNGVQRRLLDMNPRALYMPCACHGLNLTLCDRENHVVKLFHFLELFNEYMHCLLVLPKDGIFCSNMFQV